MAVAEIQEEALRFDDRDGVELAGKIVDSLCGVDPSGCGTDSLAGGSRVWRVLPEYNQHIHDIRRNLLEAHLHQLNLSTFPIISNFPE